MGTSAHARNGISDRTNDVYVGSIPMPARRGSQKVTSPGTRPVPQYRRDISRPLGVLWRCFLWGESV